MTLIAAIVLFACADAPCVSRRFDSTETKTNFLSTIRDIFPSCLEQRCRNRISRTLSLLFLRPYDIGLSGGRGGGARQEGRRRGQGRGRRAGQAQVSMRTCDAFCSSVFFQWFCVAFFCSSGAVLVSINKRDFFSLDLRMQSAAIKSSAATIGMKRLQRQTRTRNGGRGVKKFHAGGRLPPAAQAAPTRPLRIIINAKGIGAAQSLSLILVVAAVLLYSSAEVEVNRSNYIPNVHAKGTGRLLSKCTGKSRRRHQRELGMFDRGTNSQQ